MISNIKTQRQFATISTMPDSANSNSISKIRQTLTLDPLKQTPSVNIFDKNKEPNEQDDNLSGEDHRNNKQPH